MNLDAVIRHYRAHFQTNACNELASFEGEPSLEAAVRRAALAKDSRGKRCAHQRRLRPEDLERAAAALETKVEAIAIQPNFARLLELVEAVLLAHSGLGELYMYDTALRIGAKRGLSPTRVYLHRGTREGALALGLDAKRRKALDKGELPPELRAMKMHEVEDILCIYKRFFSGEQTEVEDVRACWNDDGEDD